MTVTIVIATCFSAAATVVIAWYAIANHKLASKIQSRDDEFRQQIKDLYQAIVIANIVEPTVGETGNTIKYFKDHYKGKTPIFD